MKKYLVKIKEIHTQDVFVEAEDAKQAKEMKKMWALIIGFILTYQFLLWESFNNIWINAAGILFWVVALLVTAGSKKRYIK